MKDLSSLRDDGTLGSRTPQESQGTLEKLGIRRRDDVFRSRKEARTFPSHKLYKAFGQTYDIPLEIIAALFL